MTTYSPAWPHGSLKEIFPNIFFVTGTNITFYKQVALQHSRNMVVIKNGAELTLINTIRLTEAGLKSLDALGEVKNIVRIGAFHGRDDGFYLDRYQAKLWALRGMQHEGGRIADIEMAPGGLIPFPGCTLFVFATAEQPEGILFINQDGGILVSCDSIKNWLAADEFFSAESAKLYEAQGFFGPATISDVWLAATKVTAADFARLNAVPFHHLLSAHGVPLLNDAKEQLAKTIKSKFGI